ncbi:SDR family oxidoreductase [Nocardioides carbamazepini]|uniref:SDR family NAD(P)-dependent oxidoreductase n=1 Tax=Nocardioides carbamazepini TaxID=2854259 RepID=UPI00214A1156|nr:SDR family NAD(P)-dependent oxidoreductase [Nocardioides carbamazepini]MCR1782455.1 SDR family oxidoreductase [Nocardioides carbamazepini]
MTDRLKNKTVLVTGALGGIGSATIALAAREGAGTVVLADLDGARVDAVAAELCERGVGAVGIALDVASEASWESLVSRLEGEVGGVDVLVNNAGITNRFGVLETKVEDWDRVLAVNLTGVFLGMKHAGRSMVGNRGGSIVNVASFASYTGYRAASYAASKWAVRGLTQTAADELGSRGVRVNSVSPGFVPTPLTENAPNLVRSFSDATPLGRTCAPEDIAAAVVYLASDDSSYVCGHDLLVDGGFMSNTIRDVRA